MHPFNFESSNSPKDAVQKHSLENTARFIAGGTTLVDLMRLDVEQPDLVVDITGVGLKKISERGKSLFIGALVSNAELAQNDVVKNRLPVLSEALLSGASPQLRNLATTGGNLLQRTRCTYFRDVAWACNKRQPGSGCSALEGFNRSHAILGASDACVATSPSDMNVALVALGATVHVEGKSGQRAIPIEEFFLKPGNTPNLETVLKSDELITEVEVPLTSWYRHSHYVKVRDRASYEFALTSCAIAVDLDGHTIREARVAFGGIGTVPWRSKEAEASLKGKAASRETYIAAASEALKNAKPLKHNAFKIPLAQRTLVRAFSELSAGEKS